MTLICPTSCTVGNRLGSGVSIQSSSNKWYSLNLAKGYNYITSGIPSVINVNETIIVAASSSIITFEVDQVAATQADFVCLLNGNSLSPTNTRFSTNLVFGIKFYSTQDLILQEKISVPASYSEIGVYKLLASLTYYSSNSTNIVITNLTSSLNVIAAQTSAQTIQTTSSQPFLLTIQTSGVFQNSTNINVILSNATYDINGCLLSCSNQGECVLNMITSQYECVCIEFFSGKSCKKDIRPCSSYPCLNQGRCLNHIANMSLNASFTCECFYPYYGRNCQFKIELCSNITCSGNGFCVFVGNATQCQCKQYFSGNECEVVSSKLKTMKIIISTATIATVLVFVAFVFMVLACDYTSFLQGKFKPKRRKTVRASKNEKK